jgi:hypothetical protein
MASCRIGLVVRVCVGMQCNSKLLGGLRCGQDWLVHESHSVAQGAAARVQVVLGPLSGLGYPDGERGPARRVMHSAGPPRPGIEPELLRVLAQGGDQVVLAHR